MIHPISTSVRCTTTFAFLIVLCFACILQASVVQAEGSYSHSIAYGEEECLLIRVPQEPHYISGSFDLLDSQVDPDPARVRLYDSKEELIWSSRFGASEGSFSQRGSGKHWLCLENGLTYEQDPSKDFATPHRSKVPRTIGFSLRLRKVGGVGGGGGGGASSKLADESKNDIDGTTKRLVELTDRLNENFQVLVDHMSFMKAREVVHREIHEETFTKVVRWNILEICTVVVVTFGQILNVWYILSNKRSY